MKKIVLLCASGMSTSMLVKKMQEAAAAASPWPTDSFPKEQDCRAGARCACGCH